MAKPNYSFEKRKRELAKIKKKEEKRLKKLGQDVEVDQDGQPAADKNSHTHPGST